MKKKYSQNKELTINVIELTYFDWWWYELKMLSAFKILEKIVFGEIYWQNDYY